MDEQLSQQFIRLIAYRTGLCIRPQDVKTMQEKLYLRMRALRLATPEQYYQYLLSDTGALTATLRNQGEWQHLILLLTTGESYFFRDQGQFRLLRQKILPDLIQYHQRISRGGFAKPTLRIWSAGCSTGEEAYSLAILVHELIPDRNGWEIKILGTDINSEAIEKARKGIYNSWSFRTIDPVVQSQYFHPHRDNWQVNETIRSMVTFQIGNLARDVFPKPNSEINNFDLILCRNVFIYFDTSTIATVLEKFSHALNDYGYLITGHAELHNQNLGKLVATIFPESMVYRSKACIKLGDRDQKLPASEPFCSSNLLTTPPDRLSEYSTTTALNPTLNPKPNLMDTGTKPNYTTHHSPNHPPAIVIEAATAEPTISFEQCQSLAESHADIGEYDRAKYYCQQAIKSNVFAVAPYHLLAQIAQEEGNLEEAKRLLKKVIYLAPDDAAAYLELSLLYEQEGDHTRARKMQLTALDQLQQLPSDTQIKYGENVTVGELLQQLKLILRNNS